MSWQFLKAYFAKKFATFLQSPLKPICDADLWMIVRVNRIRRVKDRTDMDCYGDDLLSQLLIGYFGFSSFFISLVNQNTDTASDGGYRSDRLNPRCRFRLLNIPVVERPHKTPKQRHKYGSEPKHPNTASDHSSRKFKILHTCSRPLVCGSLDDNVKTGQVLSHLIALQITSPFHQLSQLYSNQPARQNDSTGF
ncbi:hypothetical protein PMI24_01065 [Pseudomonas sp. GM25]|nr:hypothetical protein PMI24_01065 [Pseudomonas sp. GM25]